MIHTQICIDEKYQNCQGLRFIYFAEFSIIWELEVQR